MMVRDGAGYWTGQVRCEEKDCTSQLEPHEIKIPEPEGSVPAFRYKTIQEHGWQCVQGRHFCAAHHRDPETIAVPDE